MAKKKKSSRQSFEDMIGDVDRLPNDMPQDYKYRKRDKGSGDNSAERAPVKLNKQQSAVESKNQAVVNNLMETNNRFQTTQNTIIQGQTEVNKDQLDEDRAQTGLMQQQQKTMSQMNETMDKLYRMMKDQNEKINPKYQDKAANDPKQPDPTLGQPKNQDGGLGGLLGGALDLFGRGKRGPRGSKRERIKPTRQQRADARRNNRGRGGGGGRASGGGGAWRLGGAAASIASSIRGAGGGAMNRIRDMGRAAVGAARGAGGNKFLKLGAGVAAGTAAAFAGHKLLQGDFGSVSEKYESGGKGVATVSTGRGDHGGVSYGKHQLSSKSGTMQKFVNSPEAEKFAPYFEGLTPGSASFNTMYSKLASENKEEFDSAQGQFIQRTHYDPAMQKLQKNGIDFENRSRALNELVFSSATQYGAGGAPSKIMRALEGQDVSKMSDAEIITMIQDNKSANVGTDFRSSSSDTQASVAARAQREKADLLSMLQAEEDAKKGIDREAVDKAQGKEPEEAKGEIAPMVLADSANGSDTNGAHVGIFPMGQEPTVTQAATQSELPKPSPEVVDSSSATNLLIGGGLVGGTAAAAIAARKGGRATPITPITQGREALPVPPAAAAESATKKSLLKKVPVVGTALTVAEAALLMTDDTLTAKEKAREGTGIAGGLAGAWAGGAAGAAGGSAIGAAIGLPFGGIGAVPGAAIGGFLGGIGGSIAGYMGGDYLGKEGFDAVDGIVNPETGKVEPLVPSTSDKKAGGATFSAPSNPVGIFPMAANASSAGDASSVLTAANKALPLNVKPAAVSSKGEDDTSTLRQDTPQEVSLQQGKTTLVVVPLATPAKVDTAKSESDVAQMPNKTEPSKISAFDSPDHPLLQRAMAVASGTVANAPAMMQNMANDIGASASNAMINSAHAMNTAASSAANNLVGANNAPVPTHHVTPAPKTTAAPWSALPSATPQRVEKVSASHETPMAREAFTGTQSVNVENQVQSAPPNTQPEKMKASGIAESGSIRPELKDVPPMLTDFGIVFLNAGII